MPTVSTGTAAGTANHPHEPTPNPRCRAHCVGVLPARRRPSPERAAGVQAEGSAEEVDSFAECRLDLAGTGGGQEDAEHLVLMDGAVVVGYHASRRR